jgi:serine/tyrosine/threonine adenylyltransferase
MQLQASRFESLGPAFYTRLGPTPLPDPRWVGHSPASAQALGLPEGWQTDADLLQALTGSAVPPGASPLASVYSGHQFGHWAGQLGDGRALLLGDRVTTAGTVEIQLKGAGLTPYSRMGDGRAVLRSSIREFLCSEAMHALGIPTTRALCVTGSPAPVRREEVETAAVVTRWAPSFIRFGHFEHFSHHGMHDELRQLADFVLDHFYPECRTPEVLEQHGGSPYAAMLAAVTQRTARLLAQWQAVGFCHGVMNTDNMSILGLTIDYGPFQFLDAYDPGHICNHSDTGGRYAFGRQPNVAYWNLFCLGQALLPLVPDQQLLLDALEPYKAAFPTAYLHAMNAKLGLQTARPGDETQLENLLRLLAADRVDHTIFWRRLSQYAAELLAGSGESPTPVRDLFIQRDAFDAWASAWAIRHQQEAQPDAPAAQARMLAINPSVVLRNHLGELAIREARAGRYGHVDSLLAALQQPYHAHDDPANPTLLGTVGLSDFPPDWAAHIEISCSS